MPPPSQDPLPRPPAPLPAGHPHPAPSPRDAESERLLHDHDNVPLLDMDFACCGIDTHHQPTPKKKQKKKNSYPSATVISSSSSSSSEDDDLPSDFHLDFLDPEEQDDLHRLSRSQSCDDSTSPSRGPRGQKLYIPSHQRPPAHAARSSWSPLSDATASSSSSSPPSPFFASPLYSSPSPTSSRSSTPSSATWSATSTTPTATPLHSPSSRTSFFPTSEAQALSRPKPAPRDTRRRKTWYFARHSSSVPRSSTSSSSSSSTKSLRKSLPHSLPGKSLPGEHDNEEEDENDDPTRRFSSASSFNSSNFVRLLFPFMLGVPGKGSISAGGQLGRMEKMKEEPSAKKEKGSGKEKSGRGGGIEGYARMGSV